MLFAKLYFSDLKLTRVLGSFLLLSEMPKLTAVILEDVARQLSDHDLTNFMLSSKGAFSATINMLSKVERVIYGVSKVTFEPHLQFAGKEPVSFLF